MGRKRTFSQEAKDRAVQLFFRHRFAYSAEMEAIHEIAEQVGCSPMALEDWVRESSGRSTAIPDTEEGMSQRIEELKRERSDLLLRLELLRAASSLTNGGELDRPTP